MQAVNQEPLAELGHAMSAVLHSSDWVRRRVETIEILDEHNFRRYVSIDIDMNMLRGILMAAESGVDTGTSISRFPIPLALIPKGLLIDIDILDPSGVSLSLCDSDGMADISRNIAAWQIASRCNEGSMLLKNVDRILEGLGADVPLMALEPLDDGAFAHLAAVKRLGKEAQAEWRQIIADRDFTEIINDLRSNFILGCYIPVASGSYVLSYNWTENRNNLNSMGVELPAQAGGFATYFSLMARDVGTATREHLRVVAPKGTFMGSSIFVPSRRVMEDEEILYYDRESPERLIFYTKNLLRQPYYVIGTIWPDLKGFRTPSLILPIVSFVVLLLGGGAQMLDSVAEMSGWDLAAPFDILAQFQDPRGQALSAVFNLLVLLPSVLVAFIVREGEHELRQKLLRKGRGLALASLVPLFVSAMSLLIPFEPLFLAIIWIVSAISCAIIYFRLRRYFGRIEREYESMRDESEKTKPRKISVTQR